MSTQVKAFEHAGVFHSALVKATAGGPMALMFTGKPRDSKYPGKPPFVGFKAQNDDTAYTLNIENDGIRNVLSDVPLNVWVMVRAEGTREQAYVLVDDANGNPVLRGTPVSEIAQPKNPVAQDGPPPNEWRKVNGPHPVELDDTATKQRELLAERYFLALCAADDAVQRFAKEHAGSQPSDAVRNIATTIFIQASGR